MIPKLEELGIDLCGRLNHKANCIFRRFKWYFLTSIIILVGCYFAYNYFDNKPECEGFSSNKDLNILMVPDEGIDFASLESIAFAGLDPYLPNLKSMKGDYYDLSIGELLDIAKPCSPSLMIKGNVNNCCMKTFDPAIEKYIIENYSMHPSQFSKCNTSLEKLACVINTFLSEKNNNNNVFSNPTCIHNQFNEIVLKREIKDTLDMMIGQSMANMYEKQGKLDSAMLILERLSTTGGVNPDTVYSRMSRIASKTKNTAVELIAKTGLIKQAEKKGDQNTKEKLEKDIKVLNTKLNIEQGKVKSTINRSITTNIPKVNVTLSSRTNLPSNNTPSKNQPIHPAQTNSMQSQNTNVATVVPLNTKMYENLNRMIQSGNYQKIEAIYQNNKARIDKDPSLLSLYYESMYKAKKISDTLIPAKIMDYNQRLKANVISSKILKEH